MDRPASAPAAAAAPVRLRPERLVRLFFLVACIFAIWLAVSPTRDFFAAQERAAQTSQQLQKLKVEQARLQAQSKDLSRGNGLEEEARRQGLIQPSERSYVIEDLPRP